MKLRNVWRTTSILLTLCIALSTTISAQEASDKAVTDKDLTRNPDGTYSSKVHDEANRPEDNYLAKFHAIDVNDKLMKKNLEQVYLLKVIVSNFQAQNWRDEYKKCYDGYKNAMDLFYKRNTIYARVAFEKNKKDIAELMKKMVEQYRKDTDAVLNECSEKTMMLHLEATTRSDPNKSRHLWKNQERLRVAYGQYDDAAVSAIDLNFEKAIYHYRVAKAFGFKILESISDPAGKKALHDKYKFHKADILNRIFATKGKSSAPADTTTPKKPAQ